MDRLNNLFEQITDAWNDYFWEYKFCQDQINFTEDIKTNYYGDILSYFNETMVFLSSVEYVDDFQKSIFQAIGILQIIYAQQDLMDELLYIFKLQESKMSDKQPNRTIRNELVGHPIRRKPNGGELISSVYFGRLFRNGNIHYVLYSRANGFKGDDHLYYLGEIIKSHFEFVEKYALAIAGRLKTILEHLQTHLLRLYDLVNKGIEFKKLVDLTGQVYNPIFKENYVFKREILLECYTRREEHNRYQNVVVLFTETLKEYLPEVIGNIDDLFKEKGPLGDYEPVQIRVTHAGDNEIPGENTIIVRPSDRSEHLSYEFSKLADKHPVWGIEYFKGKFKDDVEVTGELLNMENDLENTLEFYASYEYLRKLLIQRGLLKE